MRKYLTFKTDERGFGKLTLHTDGFDFSFDARTGSISTSGKLINNISSGIWTIKEQPVDTEEIAMVVAGIGWKARLYTPEGNWSHYLIHPDGNLPGTLGCIGIQKTNAVFLRDAIKQAIAEQQTIRCYVNCEPEKGEDTRILVKPGTKMAEPTILPPIDLLESMDIFLASSMFPSGITIRTVTSGIKDAFNMKIPVHAGFITESWGQLFATEMQPPEIRENSLDKYAKKSNRIISVWRFAGFEKEYSRRHALQYLSLLRRRRLKYDVGALASFTKVLKRILPFMKNAEDKDFCSENVYRTLSLYSAKQDPKFKLRAPNPLELEEYMLKSPEFIKVWSAKV